MELTLEIARRSSEDGFLDLSESEVTRITNKAAEFLSQNVGSSLDFYYLTELSDEAAEFLSKFKGDSISLGRAEFNEEGYEKERGYLTELSDAAVESLSKYKGELILGGLTKLSDAAAESLSKHKGEAIYLNALTKISDAAAESLGKHKGKHIQLDGLTELSDAAAESLSKHKSESICLNGLTKLSDAAAESIGKYKGRKISLDGLKELSDAAAESIGKYKGSLLLRGLKKLTPTAATKLCGVDFLELTISKKNMTGALTRALAGFRGSWLGLSGFSSLSDECAHELSKFRGKKLSFNLSEHKIVRKLSREGARSLGEILNLLSSKCSIDYDLAKKAEIDLDSEQDRSPDYVDEDFAQKWIRGSSWMYSLEKAKKISNEAAVRLGQHEDEYAEFQLCNLNELSETAAVALAMCRGKLWLDGLTEVSDAVVEALAKHEGPLSLDGVTELSDAAAQSLSKHRGELSLWSVTLPFTPQRRPQAPHLKSKFLAARLADTQTNENSLHQNTNSQHLHSSAPETGRWRGGMEWTI
jgi:hypothetical protein